MGKNENVKYAGSVFDRARKCGGGLDDRKEDNLAYEVISDIGRWKIEYRLGQRILKGLLLMLFSKQNPQRPVK